MQLIGCKCLLKLNGNSWFTWFAGFGIQKQSCFKISESICQLMHAKFCLFPFMHISNFSPSLYLFRSPPRSLYLSLSLSLSLSPSRYPLSPSLSLSHSLSLPLSLTMCFSQSSNCNVLLSVSEFSYRDYMVQQLKISSLQLAASAPRHRAIGYAVSSRGIKPDF